MVEWLDRLRGPGREISTFKGVPKEAAVPLISADVPAGTVGADIVLDVELGNVGDAVSLVLGAGVAAAKIQGERR